MSWDISFNPNEVDEKRLIKSRMTESLVLGDLVEGGSGDGLERGECVVGSGDR